MKRALAKVSFTPRQIYAMLGALVIVAAGGLAYWYFMRGDSARDITLSATNLQIIGRGIKSFQSENYFGREPEKLEDLFNYRMTFYIQKIRAGKLLNEFSKIEKSYAVVQDMNVFHAPAKKYTSDKFTSDYTLLKWYKMFLPGNTVIAWDNSGNFQSGGNLLFYDGTVRFYKMRESEYKRFITGMQTKSDREFLRAKCAQMSLRGFSNIVQSADEEAQRILDQAAGKTN